MTAVTTALEPAELERLVYQVRGVYAVRIVADPTGRLDEIHVVGTPNRTAKQIVRDIESILYVRGGVRVDHRKISLVQIADTVVQPAPPRLKLLGVRQDNSDEHTTVTATLRLRDQLVHGVGSTRPGQIADLPLLAAYATVHALADLLGPRGQLHLERLQRQPLGTIEVYLAHLSFDSDTGSDTLLGISVLREEELLSVARAVLDGVNRRIERLLEV
jgi:hypothetical protein